MINEKRMNVKLTEDQQLALNSMEQGRSVFLTGAAGSGKSHVLQIFASKHDPKQFPVLSSTGASAVLVGGRTFHSFFGLGIIEGGAEKTLLRVLSDKRVLRRLKKIRGFILDEVSMIPGAVLALAEEICRRVLKSEQVWGGLQVITVGDFGQLPPVHRWGGKRDWAFLHPVWFKSNWESHVLSYNHRTHEDSYLQVLGKIREGVLDSEVEEFLNSRTLEIDEEYWQGTRLFPLRKTVEAYNLHRLLRLEGKTNEYPSVYFGSERAVEMLKKSSPLPDVLTLKNGALVMLRTNDPRQRWVNGTLAFVREMQKEELQIELFNGRCVSLEKTSFSLLDAEGNTVAAVTNFPLSLAYASTIHKSQGMTLDKVHVDLGSLWEPGQAYVALSRVRNAQDVSLSQWSKSSIRCDTEVSHFYQSIGTI